MKPADTWRKVVPKDKKEKRKLYFRFNELEGKLFFFPLILFFLSIFITYYYVGFGFFLMKTASYLFFFDALFLVLKFTYFRKAQEPFTNEGKGLSVLLSTILRAGIAIFFGVLILTRFLGYELPW